ncbi:hypothetical protein AB1Y20_009915 [Prymnesium parvum]|uniref:NADPH--hemoprotein reductase n=1 Tax=Prymnesium parvum TaxID=97485 RepID=A0AB34K3F1_PRYPA
MHLVLCAVAARRAPSPPEPPPPSGVPDGVLAVVLALVLISLTAFFLLRSRRASETSAGVSRAPAEETYPRGPLVILWGSQTGTAEAYGNLLMREAKQRGFKARSVDLEDYDPYDLKDETSPVIMLMSTHGEGEPTDNAVALYEYMNDKDARTPDELRDLKYACFALGNKQYEHFCAMGKWTQQAFDALGAKALYELGLGDDDDDLEGDFEKWREGLWEALGAGADDMPLKAPQPCFEAVLSKAPVAGVAVNVSAGASLPWLRRAFPKFTLAECEVVANKELTADPSQGSVRHIELQVAKEGKSPYLRYCTADDLAVCCDNGIELAEKAARLLGLSPSQSFTLKALPSAAGAPPPLPSPSTVAQALRFYADLRASVSKPLLLLLAAHCTEPSQADRLTFLASPDGKAEFSTYIQRDGRGLVDLLEEFPSRPPLGALLELVPKLTPRYYTIASSPAKDARTVHLTVKVLREPMRAAAGRTKVGVCSTQLEALPPGANAVVFIRESAFRLPRKEDVPVVMVGPGTGVAPFRAFLQEMEAAATGPKKRTGASWLYFGCRRSDVDFIYKDELLNAVERGFLTKLRTAFSREQASKVYVQDKLREDGEEMWRLLGEQKGHLYICGGTLMGRDVVAALHEIVVKYGKLTDEEAAKFVKQMTSGGRLVQELWS